MSLSIENIKHLLSSFTLFLNPCLINSTVIGACLQKRKEYFERHAFVNFNSLKLSIAYAMLIFRCTWILRINFLQYVIKMTLKFLNINVQLYPHQEMAINSSTKFANFSGAQFYTFCTFIHVVYMCLAPYTVYIFLSFCPSLINLQL